MCYALKTRQTRLVKVKRPNIYKTLYICREIDIFNKIINILNLIKIRCFNDDGLVFGSSHQLFCHLISDVLQFHLLTLKMLLIINLLS